jgi:septal ring factor EnvC (AmiA/AmiB activator)
MDALIVQESPAGSSRGLCRSLRVVPANVSVILAVLGLIAGPTGIIWATLNFRTDDTGKRLKQASEIVAMFQAIALKLEERLEEAEASLEAAEHRVAAAEAETAAAERALRDAQAECARLRAELHDVRSELSRLSGGTA